MFVSTKKHNQLVLELAEANLDMQRYIKELEDKVEQLLKCDPDELINHQIAHYTNSLTPIQYEEE